MLQYGSTKCEHEHFNLNFRVSSKNFLEQSSCVFSWTNERCDNITMHGKTVKRKVAHVFLS